MPLPAEAVKRLFRRGAAPPASAPDQDVPLTAFADCELGPRMGDEPASETGLADEGSGGADRARSPPELIALPSYWKYGTLAGTGETPTSCGRTSTMRSSLSGGVSPLLFPNTGNDDVPCLLEVADDEGMDPVDACGKDGSDRRTVVLDGRGAGEAAAGPGPATAPPMGQPPREFWQEVFNAASIVLGSVVVACAVPSWTATAEYPWMIWILLGATVLHEIASAGFHVECALRGGREDFDYWCSWWRCADVAGIHMLCFVCGWALSYGAWEIDVLDRRWAAPLINAISLLANSASVAALLLRQCRGLPGFVAENHRAAMCTLIYTSTMLLRGDWEDYLAIIALYGVGGLCWSLSPYLRGWGLGVFHLTLAGVAHFLLVSMLVTAK